MEGMEAVPEMEKGGPEYRYKKERISHTKKRGDHMPYISPNVREKFNSLSPELQDVILSRGEDIQSIPRPDPHSGQNCKGRRRLTSVKIHCGHILKGRTKSVPKGVCAMDFCTCKNGNVPAAPVLAMVQAPVQPWETLYDPGKSPAGGHRVPVPGPALLCGGERRRAPWITIWTVCSL